MLTTAKSANVGFSHVVQLLAPPAENAFYQFGKNFFWVSTMCAQILGFSRVRFRVRVRVRVRVSIRSVWL